MFYGIVEADLGESTLLTVGHNQQRNKAHSPLWGALPMLYANGQATNYDRSTSTSTDWAYWNTTTKSSFAELSHQFNEDWSAKAVLTRTDYRHDSTLMYVYGTPSQSTGLGLYSYPSQYAMDNRQTQADVAATGKFALFGRKHELTFGAKLVEIGARRCFALRPRHRHRLAGAGKLDRQLCHAGLRRLD